MSLSLQIPESFSRKVFADGLAAIRDGSHPCHHMIRWQEAHGVAPFQLPEPFSGRRADYRLIFVGLNPSLSFNEKIPVATADWDCARYDAFYRARFDPAQRRYDGKIIAHLKDGATKFRVSGRRSKALADDTLQKANQRNSSSANTPFFWKLCITNQRKVGWETLQPKSDRFSNTSAILPAHFSMK
ncbi:MAG: hypothetical protein HWD60_20515 [Defluviicoccus sp.]|nr:MAG: hypothetical protein HWD60_20515 [Defluviicoccus sp.]